MKLDLSNRIAEQINELQTAFAGLSFYRKLAESGPGRELIKLSSLLAREKPSELEVLNTYHSLLYNLSEVAGKIESPVVADGWQDFLLDFILTDDNPLTRQLKKTPVKKLGASWLQAALHDLRRLQQIFKATSVIRAACQLEKSIYPDWQDLNIHKTVSPYNQINYETKNVLLTAPGWESCLEELAVFYRLKGTGAFASNVAFKWFGRQDLRGIPSPDPIRISNLVDYDREREMVVTNTRQFLSGFPANNMLLYGDRGTGKSSTVKALLNEFWAHGLRLVEVPKENLKGLPLLLDLLKEEPFKFIVFIDDLSFEDTETDYLSLKAVLEGSLEGRPGNVLVYATSNRRHLVKEMVMDRTITTVKSGNEEFRVQDSLQEKLSLSDRFGITVIFASPDQHTYLNIVEGLAQQRGLNMDPALLKQRALQWTMLHNGRSGRTARQFIDQLEGELKQKKEN